MSAKGKKKIPKYMLAPITNSPALPKGGNPSQQITHDVAKLEEDGGHKLDASGNIVLETVTETYVWNQDHRTTLKADKGNWTVLKTEEESMFLKCRRFGLFKKWKSNTHMGWNILLDNNQLKIIGKGVRKKGVLIDVKVAKFVEGNSGIWHGYPIDYRNVNEDVICDNALYCWLRLNVIDKSEISDIQRKEESSLV